MNIKDMLKEIRGAADELAQINGALEFEKLDPQIREDERQLLVRRRVDLMMQGKK